VLAVHHVTRIWTGYGHRKKSPPCGTSRLDTVPLAGREDPNRGSRYITGPRTFHASRSQASYMAKRFVMPIDWSETIDTRTWTLIGPDGRHYESPDPGALGDHRKQRIYGRLDCPSARRAIARGWYVEHRVFFRDEATAIAAGFRPCGICMRDQYAAWKADPEGFRRANGAS
jgi:hypothetical protein